jgi:3',5'-cyclic AMP phosphodiesterase CpdA
VLITGDLTDHGAPDAYEHLRRILARHSSIAFVIPGNHDHIAHFRRAFNDQEYLP